MPGIESGFEPFAEKTAPAEKASHPLRPEQIEHDELPLNTMEAIDAINQKYAALEDEYKSSGATDEAIRELHKQQLDEVLRIPEVSRRGFYPNLAAALESTFSPEILDQIKNQDGPIVAKGKDGKTYLIKQSKIEGANISVIRTFHHKGQLRNSAQRSLLRARKLLAKVKLASTSPTEEQMYGPVVQSILLQSLLNGQTINLGERTPCIVRAIHEHDEEDIERHKKEVSEEWQSAVASQMMMIRTKDGDKEKIIYDRLESAYDLASFTHEIGHSWDDMYNQLDRKKKESQFFTQVNVLTEESIRGYSLQRDRNRIQSERNASAWALRELRRWRDNKFPLPDELLNEIEQIIELALSSYDSKSFKESSEALFTSMGRRFERSFHQLAEIHSRLERVMGNQNSLSMVLPGNSEVSMMKNNGFIRVDEESFGTDQPIRGLAMYDISPDSLSLTYGRFEGEKATDVEGFTVKHSSIAAVTKDALNIDDPEVAARLGQLEFAAGQIDYLDELTTWLEAQKETLAKT